MEDNVPAHAEQASGTPCKITPGLNHNQRLAAIHRTIKERVAIDSKIRKLRSAIVARATKISREVEKEFEVAARKEFLAKAKRIGVPVMPHETARWIDERRKNETDQEGE
jgi:hypothetical protein